MTGHGPVIDEPDRLDDLSHAASPDTQADVMDADRG
jgi:hypothetical protein